MAYVIGKAEKNSNYVKEASTSMEKNNTKYQENSPKNQSFLNNRYDQENTKIIKTISTLPRISAPFGSSSVKSTLMPNIETENPGPGSYDIELKNLISNIDNSNKFFITGDTRFKTKENNVPGVGEYNLANESINMNNKNSGLTPKKINRYNRITSHDFKSPTRVPTIPDKDTQFGFGENKEGKMEILIDPNIDQKFDGTRNNSIGPDRYNTFVFKHNNAIEWEKASKKNLELAKIKSNKTEDVYNYECYNYRHNLTSNSSKENSDALTEFYNFANQTDTNDNPDFKNKLIKNNLNLKNKNTLTGGSTKTYLYDKSKIYKNEKLGLKDNYDTSYIDLTSVPLKKKPKEITPGPGAYNVLSGNFNVEPKKNKYQNFGTYESRNMFPYQRIKNYKNYLDNSININEYKRKMLRTIDEKNKLNKYTRSLHNFRLSILKEQAKKLKSETANKVGPGSYSPDLYFNIANNIINNANNNNTIEIKDDRKPIYITINENPGVGEYDVMSQIKQQIDNILTLKKSKETKEKEDMKWKMENIRNQIRKKKEKEEKLIIRKEYKDTREYKIRQQFLYNYYRPAFDSAVPKFKEFGSKDDSGVGVGSYNLIYPEKKYGNIKVPFLSGSKKFSDKNLGINGEINRNVGPGSYEQRSFFDWNKKSFNVQYKSK